MIRAALLTPNFSLGGAERWVVQLLKHVDPKRVQWTGLAISGYGGADPELCLEASQYAPLHTHIVPACHRSPNAHPFRPQNVTGLHPSLQSAIVAATQDAQVLLTWGVSNLSGWLGDLQIPRICCSHTTLQETGSKMPIGGITHLASVSEIAMTYFDGRPGGEGLPRRVVYNGADPQQLEPTVKRHFQRRQWGVPGGSRVIGQLGRQSPEKNYLVLAEALRMLPYRYKAVYYGRDQTFYDTPAPDLLAMQTLPDGRGTLGERLHCYMPVTNVGDVLSGLDVLVIPSHREAFSLMMIEAWLTGVPVVATPVGAVPELKQKYGDLTIDVPLNPSPEQLAAGIEEAFTPRGRELAKYAQQVANQHFTVKAMARNWAEYLESVVC